MSDVDSIEVAVLRSVSYNKDTGQVFLRMEVEDPVWKQKFLHEWTNLKVKLVIERNDAHL